MPRASDAATERHRPRGRRHCGSELLRFYGLAAELGAAVAEEVIALRPGAHAYGAKPGTVPPHIDHGFPAVSGAGAVFCSPWLRSADPVPLLEQALDRSRDRLAAAETTSIRLAPGDALFVDNRRVLHGRGAIDAESRRRLRRARIA